MRIKTIRLLPAAILAGLLAAGCASSSVMEVRQPATPDFPNGEVVVRPVSERPQREFQDDHVWIPSYWFATQDDWVLIPGHWE